MIRRPAQTQGPGRLPNLIVIGAQKCGTTSLHYYLGLHPEIFMSEKKELNFFTRHRNWGKGVEWYRSQFLSEAKVCGESSPSYTNYPSFDGVPERIYSIVPEAKLIYVVRNPIERVISHYVHQYAKREENRPIEDALEDPDTCEYVQRSRYSMQLEQYLRFFPPSSILVVGMEQLAADRRQALQEVFRFLGVDESFSSPWFRVMKHRSRDKRRHTRIGSRLARLPGIHLLDQLPPDLRWHIKRVLSLPFSRSVARPVLNEDVRRALTEYFKPDVERLRELTGREFSEWSV